MFLYMKCILKEQTHTFTDFVKNTQVRAGPRGRVVKFACSALAARGFTSSDPRSWHGTAHQAMLRQRPTQHNQKDLQLCTGGFWLEE